MNKILFLMFFLYACGSKDSDTSSVNTSSVTVINEDGSSTVTSLKGTWQSPCIEEDGYYSRDTVSFDENKRTRKIGMFSDKSCRQKFFDILAEYSFKIGKRVDGLTNTYEIDFSVDKIELTIITEDAVIESNSSMLFGYDTWKQGEAKDISGKNSTPNKGQKILSIIKIESTNEIFEGQRDDDEDYITRPTELSTVSLKRI